MMSTTLPVPIPAPTGNAGQFKKGRSGNPGGRPPGARNHATIVAATLLEGEAERLTRLAVDRAIDGDMVALRLCLERILPVLRSRRIHLDLPESEGADGVAENVDAALAATVRAMAGGEITPDEAMTVSGVLELRRRAIETVDLERRLARLEDDARSPVARFSEAQVVEVE
jgi:hypothetical protein